MAYPEGHVTNLWQDICCCLQLLQSLQTTVRPRPLPSKPLPVQHPSCIMCLLRRTGDWHGFANFPGILQWTRCWSLRSAWTTHLHSETCTSQTSKSGMWRKWVHRIAMITDTGVNQIKSGNCPIIQPRSLQLHLWILKIPSVSLSWNSSALKIAFDINCVFHFLHNFLFEILFATINIYRFLWPIKPRTQWVTGSLSPGGKAAGTWWWPLTSISCLS